VNRLDATTGSIAALRRATRERLEAAGLLSPALEADLLLSEVSGLERGSLFAWPERVLGTPQLAALESLVSRRLAGEPIAYLLGRREFWSLELQVSPATLIPRPETETLVEQALLALPADAPLRVADLGTGSGAIAAALACERPRWTLIGIDESPAALAVAATNARQLGLENLHLVLGDWSATMKPSSLDAILANPPYVRTDDPHLAQGDLRFEPQAALVAGADGLDAIRAIIADASRCLVPGGLLAIEHGWDQGPEVRALMQQQDLEKIETLRDLAGQERVTRAHRRTSMPSS
jgi:release factor glutamine methyltransferase